MSSDTGSRKAPSAWEVEHGKDPAAGPALAAPVDTVHQDEAMRVLGAYTGEAEWSEDEEKRLRRRLDWRLMPVLCATYGLQYYDKAMLSQAVCLSLTAVFSRKQSTDGGVGALWVAG